MAKQLNLEQLQQVARVGARARVDELQREVAAIRAAFPDLFGRGGRRGGRKAADTGTAAAAPRRRRRSKMSAAARKAVSERMRKYWADRRKGKPGQK